MGEEQEDYAKSLYHLAIGYFVMGPIAMALLIGLIALVRWLI
jgi:hypothetical protein